MSRKRIITIVVLVVLIVAALLYFFVDPAHTSWMPRCVILSITGFKCPGCGSQRMIHALMHGDLRLAAHYNAFLLGAIPVIVLYLINDYTSWCPLWLDKTLKHPATIATLAVMMIAWWVLRNIFNW